MKRFKILVGLLILLLLVIFASFNSQGVIIYYWKDLPLPILGYEKGAPGQEGLTEAGPKDPRGIPVFLLVFVSLILGYLLSWFIGIGDQYKTARAGRKARKQAARLEMEVENLRKKPVSDLTKPPEEEPS